MTEQAESPAEAKFILFAMNRLNKPMYEGTVPGHVKERRRRRNRAARRARRLNR